MAQWWLWCAGGDEDVVATAVDSWLGWRLVSLQMPSAHAGFPSPSAPGLRQPAFHVSFSIVHPLWEVQRPGGILQALVGFGDLWRMLWNAGMKTRCLFESQLSALQLAA